MAAFIGYSACPLISPGDVVSGPPEEGSVSEVRPPQPIRGESGVPLLCRPDDKTWHMTKNSMFEAWFSVWPLEGTCNQGNDPHQYQHRHLPFPPPPPPPTFDHHRHHRPQNGWRPLEIPGCVTTPRCWAGQYYYLCIYLLIYLFMYAFIPIHAHTCLDQIKKSQF